MIKDNGQRLSEALRLDLGRPPIESDLWVLSRNEGCVLLYSRCSVRLDISPSLSEAKDAYDNVEKWAKTERA